MAGPSGAPNNRGARDVPDGSNAAERGRAAGLSRRNALGVLVALPLVGAVGRTRVAAATGRQDDENDGDTPASDAPAAGATGKGRPPIRPRADWGSQSPPNGTVRVIDVNVLIVHHTEAPEGAYEPSEVPELIQGIFNFQTSDELGWPDIGFNFIVDEFGTIWEGRQGSIDASIACEVEGGDPGYTQHCAFLGDFSAVPPTPLAIESMVSLLAWLANRDQVPTATGDLTDFLSEGNDKFPAGEKVTVRTIAGHRDIADVACPGDPIMTDVVGGLQGLVNGERARLDPDAEPEGGPATSAAGGAVLPGADDQSTTSVFERPPVTRREVGFEATPLPVARPQDDLEGNEWAPAAITGGVAAAALGAGVAYLLHRRRTNRPAKLPQRSLARAALASGESARAAAEQRTVESSRALVVRPDGVDGGSAGWIMAGEAAAVGWALSAGWSDDAHDQALRELRTLAREFGDARSGSEGRAFGDAVTASLLALVGGTPSIADRDSDPGSGPGAVIFLHGRSTTSVVRLGSAGFVLPGEQQRPEWARVTAKLALSTGAVGAGQIELTTLARQWQHSGRMPVAVAWLGPTDEDEMIDALTAAHDSTSGNCRSSAVADDTIKVREAMLRAGLVDLGLVVL